LRESDKLGEKDKNYFGKQPLMTPLSTPHEQARLIKTPGKKESLSCRRASFLRKKGMMQTISLIFQNNLLSHL